jgi:hypothetical protein
VQVKARKYGNEEKGFGEIILAVQYWHAARILMNGITEETKRLVSPVCHLLCHSAELALKHFLIQKDVPRNQLSGSNIGHRLIDLFRKAGERGLRLNTRELLALLAMDEAHKNHYFRYGFIGTLNFEHPNQMLEVVASLIDVCSGDTRVLRCGYGINQTDFEWPVSKSD